LGKKSARRNQTGMISNGMGNQSYGELQQCK